MNPAPHPATADLRATLLTWGPIVAGLAFMYGPSFVDLFRGIWSTDEQAHGPIVLGVSCWLVWRNWPAMWARSEGAQTSAAGWPVVVFGLLLNAANNGYQQTANMQQPPRRTMPLSGIIGT